MPDVALRPLRRADLDALVAWGEDEEFCAAAEWAARDVEERRAHWRRIIEAPPPELLRLAVQLDGQLVGTVDLHGSEPTRRELGFVVARPFWGRGVGLAAAIAGLDHGFGTMGLDRIWAEAWAANRRSVAILERLMHPTGSGETGSYRGEVTRYVQYAITREEWLRHR